MTLEQAIKILENHQCDMPRNEVPDLIRAIQLGVGALKRIQSRRDLKTGWEITPLPGETTGD